MNRIILLVSLLATTLWAEKKLTISTMVQPLYESKENGDFKTDGESELSLHRAKVSLKAMKELEQLILATELSVDFAENEFSEMLKNGNLSLEFSPYIGVKAGRFKSPFGYESALSSKNVPFIFRGELSDYLRNSVGLGGYMNGISFYGETGSGKLNYSFSLFDYSGFSGDGGEMSERFNHLTSLPMLNLSFSPTKKVNLNYSFAVPYVGGISDGELNGARYIYNDLAVSFKHKWYQAAVELMLGPSVENIQDMALYLENLEEGINQGTSFYNSFEIPLPAKWDLLLSGRFEHLNGLAVEEGELVDRSFYYTLTGGIRLSYKKDFYLDFNIDEKFDDGFSAIDEMRIGVQLTGMFKHTWKKSESDVK